MLSATGPHFEVRRANTPRRFFVLMACLPVIVAWRGGLAQAQALSGVVRNEAGDLLQNAAVILDAGAPSSARTLTDNKGVFQFSSVVAGKHRISATAIGHSPHEQEVVVGDSGVRVVIVMRRLATPLANVVVRGRRTGVFGKVAAKAGFAPISGSSVEVLTTRARVVSDTAGNFELFKDVPAGRYVLFVKHSAFQSRMMSVNVPKDSAVEVLLLLDSLSAPGGKRMVGPLQEFNQRARWIGTRSALVPGVELEAQSNLSLADALRYAPSFLRKGLILHEAITCLYIDGLPQPMKSASDIPAANIESVEVYGLRSDYTGTADLHWPSGIPCGNPDVALPKNFVGGGTAGMKTGVQPRNVSSRRMRWDDYARAVFVWLRH